MECAPCLLEPLMDKVLHHPQIEVITSAEADEVLGYLGNFTAVIRKHARHVDVEGCYGCPTCSEACPVEVPDQYSAGMTNRKAIYLPYPGSMPYATIVDEKACLRFNGGECELCVGACPFGVIDLSGGDELIERRVGAVILATGSTLTLDPGSAYELPSVMTTWEFERVLNPDGPTGGEIRLADGSAPKRIAFVYCADSAANAPAATCSQTCCLALTKQTIETAHKLPDSSIVELVYDRNLGGPHYVHLETARNVQTVRLAARDTVAVSRGDSGAASMVVTMHGVARTAAFDLVVMAPPHAGDPDAVALAHSMSVDTDDAGYVLTANRLLGTFASRVDGIFVAGSAQGEKSVANASAHAAAAAGAVLSALVPGKKLIREATYAVVDDQVCGGCRVCTLSCPFKAVTFDAERGVAVVNELLCRGCGTCASACPSSAIAARSFTDSQLLAEIHVLSAGHYSASKS
jgi:heterodisulfide reductase subunit A